MVWQLAVDVVYVRLERRWGNVQLRGYFRVGAPFHDKGADLLFPMGETVLMKKILFLNKLLLQWVEYADKLFIALDQEHVVHLTFDGSPLMDLQTIMKEIVSVIDHAKKHAPLAAHR